MPLPIDYNLTADAAAYITGYVKTAFQEMHLSDGQTVRIYKYTKAGSPDVNEVIQCYLKSDAKHYFFVGLWEQGKATYGWVREKQTTSGILCDPVQGSIWEFSISGLVELPIPMPTPIMIYPDLAWGHDISAFDAFIQNLAMNGGYDTVSLAPDYYGTAQLIRKRYDLHNNAQFDYVVEVVSHVFRRRETQPERWLYDVFYKMEGHKGNVVTTYFDWTLVSGMGMFYEPSGLIRPDCPGYAEVV